MSVTKFRIRHGKIERVEVLRETEQSVFLPKSLRGKTVGERREAKHTDWTNYFDTWAGAHQFLMAEAQSKVVGARRQLELANAAFGNIKGMKPPAEVKPEGESNG